jgi:hypothetical protein
MQIKSSRSRLPNFLVIGAMKSGTTSLHFYLSRHPEIMMAEGKETDFFAREELWQLGAESYRNYFRETTVKFIGESCPNYAKFPYFPNVPERIYQIIPKVKIIYLVRNPLERIFSQYFHALLGGTESRNPREALLVNEKNQYLDLSRYQLQAERYEKFKDFLFVNSLDLLERQRQTLNKIFCFIGAHPFWHDDFMVFHHTAEQKMHLYRITDEHALVVEGLLTNPSGALTATDTKKILVMLEHDIQFAENALGKKLDSWRDSSIATARLLRFREDLSRYRPVRPKGSQ